MLPCRNRIHPFFIFSALFSIVLLGSFLRLWRIGSVPYGMTNDEGGGIYTALSIWQTGRSLDGKLLPLNFNLDNSFAPVFEYLTAPFIGIFGPTPMVMRVSYVVMSLLGIGLLYGIAKRLFQSEWIALSCAFVYAVSPWSIHMNRGSYDGPIVLFFLWFLYVFICTMKTGSILWSLPILTISFYSYHATKLFLLPFVPFLLFVYHKTLWKRKKERMVFLLGCAVVFASFVYVAKTQGVTRQKVLLFSDISRVAQEVDRQREFNSAPWAFRVIVNNKFTYFAKYITGQYLGAFSPEFLFLFGEGGIYGTYNHGVLYLFELPLLFIGILSILRQKDRRTTLLVFGGLLLAPVPSSLAIDKSYALRSIMMLPFFAMIIGVGFWTTIEYLAKRRRAVLVSGMAALMLGYMLSIVLYVYQYHFRYSIYGAEYWFASSRDVVELIQRKRSQYDHILIGDPGAMFIFQYGVFAKSSLGTVKDAWNMPWPKSIDNVTFLERCLNNGKTIDPAVDLPPKSLYIVRDSCHKDVPAISDIRDRAEPLRVLWKIYERTSEMK
jgi:4-amino-4-deoxy-L-arabinose transferase-like glycosyltransferase